MIGRVVRSIDERAPCGKRVGGRRYWDSDDQGLVLDNRTYDCGCRQLHYEFHDGSCLARVIHHNGTVLAEKHCPEYGG